MGKPAEQPSTLEVQWLGRRGYAEIWELQKRLLEQRIDGAIGDTLLLVEHEPVYTWGKRTDPEHLGEGPTALQSLGADVFQVERGGEVTYHGPGQLTGYPICNLTGLRCGRDLHKYMRGLEEMIIRVLASYGLQGERIDGLTGVWVEQAAGGRRQAAGKAKPHAPSPKPAAKVAALGVRVRKWCTMHGFALNVTDECLPWFRHITPCGIDDRGVTSLEKLIGRAPGMSEVRGRVVEAFREVLLR
ncbi:MAG: lipoyl(octanoyl) transferase LipB [Planctomycetes bacterium]|nr:lipoyl(octanoyl) transferase LipB [Planctomycetota bacterium]MCB9935739.1 lipoyl(octanoyl) transferase LipB [Planctomycetota bacterium]